MLNFVNWFKFPTIQYKNLLIMVLIAILMTLHPIECHIEMLPWRLVVKLLTSPMFLLLGKWLQWCLCTRQVNQLDMWQSQVEIQHYSVAYFDRMAVFKAL